MVSFGSPLNSDRRASSMHASHNPNFPYRRQVLECGRTSIGTDSKKGDITLGIAIRRKQSHDRFIKALGNSCVRYWNMGFVKSHIGLTDSLGPQLHLGSASK